MRRVKKAAFLCCYQHLFSLIIIRPQQLLLPDCAWWLFFPFPFIRRKKYVGQLNLILGWRKLMGSNYVVAIGVGNCDKLSVQAGHNENETIKRHKRPDIFIYESELRKNTSKSFIYGFIISHKICSGNFTRAAIFLSCGVKNHLAWMALSTEKI